MHSYFAHALWLLAAVFAPAAAAADAAALLTGMAEKLTGTERFSVTIVIRYDAVQEILKRGADTGIFFAGAKSRGAFSAELTPQDKEFLRAVSIKPER